MSCNMNTWEKKYFKSKHLENDIPLKYSFSEESVSNSCHSDMYL